jgi:hypothetical protein
MRPLSFLLFLCGTLAASSWEFTPQVGIGQGKLKWEIGTPDHSISTLSKLEWERLRYYQLAADLKGKVWGNFFLFAAAEYGKIFEGINKDYDYGKNHHEGLFNFSAAQADKGELFDFDAALGYEWELPGFNLSLMGGYNYAEQHVRQMSPAHFYYNGENDPFFPSHFTYSGKIEGLHSNYRTRWQGPWGGVYVTTEWYLLKLEGFAAYHHLDYQGIGHWNLRDDLAKKFTQNGNNGQGFRVGIKASVRLAEQESVGLSALYTDWRIKNGVDQVSFYDYEYGTEQIKTAKVPLNGVYWNSFVLSLVYTRHF